MDWKLIWIRKDHTAEQSRCFVGCVKDAGGIRKAWAVWEDGPVGMFASGEMVNGMGERTGRALFHRRTKMNIRGRSNQA